MSDASPLAQMKARLKAGTKNVKVVDWPGSDGVQVGLVPLTGAGLEECEVEALRLVDQVPESPHVRVIFHEIYERELGFQLLSRGLVEPSTGRPFATSAQELKHLCQVNEALLLVEELLAWTEEVSPSLAAMEEGDLAKKAAELGKASASATSSSGTSGSGRKPSSASRRSTAPTGSSSTSTPAPSPSTPRPRRFAATQGTKEASSSAPGPSTAGS